MVHSFAKLEWVKAEIRSDGRGAGARAVRYLLTEWGVRQLFRFQCPTIEWGRNVRIEGKLVIRGQGRVVIGDGCVFVGASGAATTISVHTPHAVVTIGPGTSLNGTTILASERVEVGRDCTLGACLLFDSDYHPVVASSRLEGQGGRTRPVTIGDRVWLAGGVVVLKGVIIGDEAVIGPDAVVRESVSPRTLVVADGPRIVREF